MWFKKKSTLSNNKVKNGNFYNKVTNYKGDVKLTKTDMYRLLEAMYNRSECQVRYEDYTLNKPAKLMDKIDYNKAEKLKLSLEYYPNLDNFEDVINDFEDSQRIIGFIRRIYIDDLKEDELNEKVQPGVADAHIDHIRTKLYDLLSSDYNCIKDGITKEQIVEFISICIIYVFEKCKILRKPGDV